MGPIRAGADARQDLVELRAVRQPGEHVVPGVELELLVRELALRDVDDRSDEAYRLPGGIVLSHGDHLDPACRLVAADGSIFAALSATGLDDVSKMRQDALLIVGVGVATDRLRALSRARVGRNRHPRQREQLVRPGRMTRDEVYPKVSKVHEAVYA